MSDCAIPGGTPEEAPAPTPSPAARLIALDPEAPKERIMRLKEHVPYVLPVLFTLALAIHYAGVALSRWMPEPVASTEINETAPQRETPAALDPGSALQTSLAAQASTVPTPSRAPRQKPREAAVRNDSVSVPGRGTERPANGQAEETVITGDADGIRVFQRPLPAPAGTPSPAPAVQIPTGGQLDGIEFTIDTSPGSIEELVRNVDGAFVRNGRYYDSRGNLVASTSRFWAGSRLIIFYAVDDALQVVLPGSIVESILRQVALKSPSRPPRRVTARFDTSGGLKDVDVEA